MSQTFDWQKENILKIGNEEFCFESPNTQEIDWRKRIEPWLTAVFQSEHFSLLVGTGLTKAVTSQARSNSQVMTRIKFHSFQNEIRNCADNNAKKMGRGEANFEDDLRTALELLKGLQILGADEAVRELKVEVDKKLLAFIRAILQAEHSFLHSDKFQEALIYLKSFLISFASRTASRDRLHIFTTNYDRFVEYGCDMAGIFTLDRFIGKIQPIFRSSKIDLDYHYNPPGIRGEPRYVEGVARLTKLHGSIDWRFDGDSIFKTALPFGADESHPEVVSKASDHIVIYPNSSKGVETAYYPYSELFRDFASAVCRPNSSLVIYGYGFGDSHINRILQDMLTIPSTHIVVISFDKASGRIEQFFNNNNPSQITLMIGKHFGNLANLVDEYLPKAAIDRLSERMQKNLEKRGLSGTDDNHGPIIGEKTDEK